MPHDAKLHRMLREDHFHKNFTKKDSAIYKRICFICNNNFFSTKGIVVCPKCAKKCFNLGLISKKRVTCINKKIILFKKYGNIKTCCECSAKIDYERKNFSFYCKDCLDVKITCAFFDVGCNGNILHGDVLCLDCRKLLRQKNCPICNINLIPPSINYEKFKYKDIYYCSQTCYGIGLTIKENKQEISRKNKNIDKSIKIINSNCINSIALNFILKKIDFLGNILTTGDMVDIMEDYMDYRRDDFIEEGREQLKQETSLELDKLYKEQTKILNLTTKFNFCLRSGKVPNTDHHVIPRAFEEDYGSPVIHSLFNKLLLERKSHDDIESKTYDVIKEYLEQNKKLTIEDLIYKIYFGFNGEDFKEINNKRIAGIVQTLMLQGFSQKDAASYAPVINNMLADKVEKYSRNKRNTKWFMIF